MRRRVWVALIVLVLLSAACSAHPANVAYLAGEGTPVVIELAQAEMVQLELEAT